MNCILSSGHNTYARMATQGLGVDRHLQGMKMAALENDLPVPEIFSDPGYTRSARMRLSTSQISSAYGSFTCFGPLQVQHPTAIVETTIAETPLKRTNKKRPF